MGGGGHGYGTQYVISLVDLATVEYLPSSVPMASHGTSSQQAQVSQNHRLNNAPTPLVPMPNILSPWYRPLNAKTKPVPRPK